MPKQIDDVSGLLETSFTLLSPMLTQGKRNPN